MQRSTVCGVSSKRRFSGTVKDGRKSSDAEYRLGSHPATANKKEPRMGLLVSACEGYGALSIFATAPCGFAKIFVLPTRAVRPACRGGAAASTNRLGSHPATANKKEPRMGLIFVWHGCGDSNPGPTA